MNNPAAQPPSSSSDGKKAHRRRLVLAGSVVFVLFLAVALWRLLGSGGPELAPLPDDPAERARMFHRELRENPIERPDSAKPSRTAYRDWLEARGAQFSGTQQQDASRDTGPGGSPPPVVDFGTTQFPTAPENAEPAPIQPNEYLDEEDLRHPEIYFEVAQHYPDMNNLSERRATLRFFQAYQEQLRRKADEQIGSGEDAKTVAETHAAVKRYDEAINQLRGLIDQQVAEQKAAGTYQEPIRE